MQIATQSEEAMRIKIRIKKKDIIIVASANKIKRRVFEKSLAWIGLGYFMSICLQANGKKSDGTRWMSFTCAQLIRKRNQTKKKTQTIFRSNAIRSKVYFPHELLQWPMEVDLYSMWLFFFLPTHNASKSSCRTQIQSHRCAQSLQAFFCFDWLCSVWFSTKSDERVPPKKNHIFQCVCYFIRFWSAHGEHMRERDMLYWFTKVGQCSCSVARALSVCECKAENDCVQRKWINIKSDYYYYYRYCCHSFFSSILLLRSSSSSWRQNNENKNRKK